MSRTDVPTLRCDRCGDTTQDLTKMASFNKLVHYHMSGKDEWDLCPPCWSSFQGWLGAAPQQEDQ